MIHYIVSIVSAISFVTVVVGVLFLKECDDNYKGILPCLGITAIAGVMTLIGVYLVCVEKI